MRTRLLIAIALAGSTPAGAQFWGSQRVCDETHKTHCVLGVGSDGSTKIPGAVSIGTPLPAAAPPAGSINIQGKIYQNGVEFVGGAGDSNCTKYTTGFAALTDADLTQDVTLVSLAAGAKITGITIEPTVGMTATGLQKLTAGLGFGSVGGALIVPNAYTPDFKIHTPVIGANVTSDGSGVMTVTTVAAHNLVVGDRFTLASCATAGLNGEWAIATTPTTTTLTVTGTGQNNANSASCVMSTVTDLPGATNGWYDDGGHFSARKSAHDIIARFTAVGANLNTLTAGSVDVYLCTVTTR